MSGQNTKSRKAVILGLDGVPYSLLIDYMERGMMPELGALCESGSLMPMRSSIPEVSSVAWSTFMTGKNPGHHGIFGFMEIDRQTYDYVFPDFSSLKEKTLWESNNTPAVIVNMPQTYPARAMNGVLVSGFVAPDLRRATYPERVFRFLEDMHYATDVNAGLAAENPGAFFENLFDTFSKRKEAFEYLFDTEEWELFIAVVTETDRLHHFFFHSAQQGKHFHIFERFYSELDRFIGKIAKKASQDGAVFLTCSDHGFAPILTEVYINKWLEEQGYLKLNGAEGLKGMSSDTKAFCLDPSRVYIHRAGIYGRGSVRETAAKELLNELKERFSDMSFNGQKVIQSVFSQEELFRGKHAHEGPDLYLLPHRGFDLKGRLGKPSVFSTSHFQGMHTYDDAHLFISEKKHFDDLGIEMAYDIIRSYL